MKRGKLKNQDYDAVVPFSIGEVYDALFEKYPERFNPHVPYVTTKVIVSPDGVLSIRLRHTGNQ